MSNEQKNSASNGVSEAPPPERVWITWDDAYPWTTPESGGTEYALVQPPVTQDSSETAVEVNFHKFVGTGAGELGMTPCERCGALERDLIHVDKFRKTTGERVPSVHIDDYRNAPSGVGPLASTWKDKPHRLLYDLCKELERARAYSPSEIPSSTFALLKWQLEKISEHPCPMCADCIEILGNDIVPIVDSIIERLAASPSGRPCSACGDGDTAMKYHSHDASPPVDEATPERLRFAPKHLKLWICCRCLSPRLYGSAGDCGCSPADEQQREVADYFREDVFVQPAVLVDEAARKAAEKIAREFNLIHDGWVTVGRIKVDIESETETFERTNETAVDRIIKIIATAMKGEK